MLKRGCGYMKAKLSSSQSLPDKPRIKARGRMAMFPKPEIINLAALAAKVVA
jgi:hypothetical protein